MGGSDVAGLSEFISRLQRLAAGDVIRRAGSAIADASHRECVRGFVEKRDPYGTPWAPRKKPSGWAALVWPDDGHLLLDKTGAGFDSLTARFTAGRVVMRIRGYFRFHQMGAHHAARSDVATGRTYKAYSMPARKVFPDPERGLGTWSAPINAAARDAVVAAVKG
jgi:hypothetical protein